MKSRVVLLSLITLSFSALGTPAWKCTGAYGLPADCPASGYGSIDRVPQGPDGCKGAYGLPAECAGSGYGSLDRQAVPQPSVPGAYGLPADISSHYGGLE